MTNSARIILLDLETLPDAKAVMKVFPGLGDYPGLTLKASITSIICAGWKVYGESRVHCINAWDYAKRWKADVNDDFEVVKAISDVIAKADVVVTHNGKRFDWKHLQTRLIYHKLNPLPDVIHIDTCQEAKKHLYLFNNRLNTLATFLTDQKKLENGGWELWVRVLERDPKALKLMERYCKQDIRTLEAVFTRLKPLIKTMPNQNVLMLKEGVCPRCGSDNITSQGRRVSKSHVYQRYQCQDCGGWAQLAKEKMKVL